MPGVSAGSVQRVDSCDVVVVGGGIVGALAAARCAREGRKTALLEAVEIAGGATGRSTGLVMAGLVGHYAGAVERYGRTLARDVWELTIEGRRRLVELAERLGVPVQHTGSLAVAADDTEAAVLSESARLLRQDGFDVWFSSSDPLRRGFRAALRSPNDVTLNAAELTQALLESRIVEPVTVHQGTEVFLLESEGKGVRVWARGRTLYCGACIVAADGYAPLLDLHFADRVTSLRGLTLATEPLASHALERPCCAHYGTTQCRQLPDRRLLFGAWREPERGPSAKDADGDEGDTLFELLTRFAARYFPEAQPLGIERWSGVSGFARDGLPLVGLLPEAPQVAYAVGLGGRGLALAAVAAERAAELALFGSDPGVLASTRLGSG